MNRIIPIAIILLLISCSPKNKTVMVNCKDTVDLIHDLSITDFKCRQFGMLGYMEHSFLEDTLHFPSVPNLVHESAYAICPTDTCFAEYTVLALRCPPIQPLLNWLSDSVRVFIQECPIGNGLQTFNDKKKDIPQKHLNSTEAICDFYIGQLRHVYDDWHCTGFGDHGCFNEQAGLLIADCWNSGNLFTFYRNDWYDCMSSGNNIRESFCTVDAITGNLLNLEDLVHQEKIDTVASLMMSRLVDASDEYYIHQFSYDPTEYVSILRRADGCALISEGLIFYYYPYTLAAGASGEYKSIIPYEELDGILKEDLFAVD